MKNGMSFFYVTICKLFCYSQCWLFTSRRVAFRDRRGATYEGGLSVAVRSNRQAEPWDGTGQLFVYKHCDERLDNPPRPSTRTIYTVIDELLAVFVCLFTRRPVAFRDRRGPAYGDGLYVAVRSNLQAEPWDGTDHLFVYKHCDVRCIQSFIHAVAAATAYNTSLLRCET